MRLWFKKRQLRQRTSIHSVTAAVKMHGVTVSQSSVYKSMKKDLHYKKLSVRKCQMLKERDYDVRVQRCNDFIGMGFADEDDFLPTLIFSDECCFPWMDLLVTIIVFGGLNTNQRFL